jgi:hypothetical protein
MRALLGLLFCVSLAAQTASIEGTVVNQVTGQPIEGVHLHFLMGDFSDGGYDPIYGAVSDRSGHFSITGMNPGIYQVVPERKGFVPAPPAINKPVQAKFVPLKAGQELVQFKVEMTPRATISGRVVDEYGDPVKDVFVQLEAVSGGPQIGSFFFQWGNSADDLGTFHLVTAPGRYYLHANIFLNGDDTRTEIRTDGTSGEPFVSTYYPNATSRGAASVVEAAPGQDVAGIEIRLARAPSAGPGHAITISGVVTGAPANNVAMVTVVLRHGESFDQLYNSSETNPPDGKFRFAGLQPGAYRILARYSSGKTAMQSQTVDLTLDSSDETNVQLALAPAVEITGTLVIDSDPAAAVQHTVHLEPADAMNDDGDPEATPGVVDRNGAFRIANVVPTRFRPVVEPMPDDGFIRSVTVDGTVTPDNVIDFSRGVKDSQIQIAVSRNGAQISGSVLDREGKPAAGPMIFIFLVDDPKKLRQMDSRRLNKAVDAQYSLKAVRPGKYRLFAVDTLSLAASADDVNKDDAEEMTKTLFNSAEEIEIKAGDRIVKDLKVIDKVPAKEHPPAAQNQ